ncbi:hypothetical protein ACHAXS_014417, partial [Conticribra weissflogii]
MQSRRRNTTTASLSSTAASLVVSTACLCLLSLSDANNVRRGGSSSSASSSSSFFPVFVDSASTATKTTTRKTTHGINSGGDVTAAAEATPLRLNPEMPRRVRDMLLRHYYDHDHDGDHDHDHDYDRRATNSKHHRRSSLLRTHGNNNDAFNDKNYQNNQNYQLPQTQPRHLTDCLTSYHMSITSSDPGYPHTCTNADHYPPDWDQPMIRKHLFYKEPGDCCVMYFGEEIECMVVDVCEGGSVFVIGGKGEETEEPTGVPTDWPTDGPTDVPTDGPTNAPTYAPTNAPTNIPTVESTSGDVECGAWHPDEKSMWTCTNDGNYTSTWTLFYPTGEACCQGFFNGPCTLIDACGGDDEDGDMNQQSDNALTPTVNPTNHPVATSEPTVSPTNTPTKSPTNTPSNIPTTNTPTTDPTGAPTIYTSICPTSTTTNGNDKWHLSMNPNDIKTCTNDKNYPASWDEASPQAQASVFFESAVLCCVTLYGDVHGCNIVEVCHDDEQEEENEEEEEEEEDATTILPPCPGNKWHKSYQTG